MLKDSNFTKRYFAERAEMLNFILDNHNLFKFVSYSYACQDDGRWLLVY